MAAAEPKICMFPYGRLIWCSAPYRYTARGEVDKALILFVCSLDQVAQNCPSKFIMLQRVRYNLVQGHIPGGGAAYSDLVLTGVSRSNLKTPTHL